MTMTFGQVGLANARVVPDITSSGRDAFLGTPLWPGGPQICDLPGDACPDLPSTSNDDPHKTRVWDFWLTDYDPDYWPNVFEGDDKAKEPVKGSKGKELYLLAQPHRAYRRTAPAARRASRRARAARARSYLLAWPRAYR